MKTTTPRTPIWLLVELLCWHYADKHGLRLESIRELRPREAVRKDGHCSVDGELAFDLRKLEPYRVLELVCHELAHLAHFDHNEKWIRLHAELLLDFAASGELDRIKQACEIKPA